MNKTLFIASFPDLSCFDFSKTSINVGNIDNSDYFFNVRDSSYIHSYVNSLKSMAGSCDIVFVPATDSVISSLVSEGIKCIVLYPNIDCKDSFIKDMNDSGVDSSFVSMVSDSWNFIISKLDKHDYDYKFVMDKEDRVLDILKVLLSKKDILGFDSSDAKTGISDYLVNNIFSYCLVNENEIVDGKPTIQSTYCEGINFDYLFSTQRLNDKKEDIGSLIESISAIEDGISVSSMGITREGKKWTDSFDTLEKVMALGVSTGDLILPFSRDLDRALKGSVPYVIKTKSLEKRTTI